jgi:chorismate-pyruvate lyase
MQTRALSNPQVSVPPATTISVIHPLDELYALANRELPEVVQIDCSEVPEPYRQLLVHSTSMTRTLDEFHGGPIDVRVLSRHTCGGFYLREVILISQRTGRPVEFAAIKIRLDLFAAQARRRILEEQMPLGTILCKFAIPHFSCPGALLRVEADVFIKRTLRLRGRHTLYGRRNTLVDPQQRWLAEVVEIVPPTEPQ